MVGKMSARKFFQEDKGGPIATEYVIFVAAIGTILVVGVYALFTAMSQLFNSWAGYFMPGG
jgi:Flp pilus assembly pilin Flp